MATKRIENTKMHGLTKRQRNIIRLRTKLNKSDPNAVKVFTKYKIITYIFVLLFPPYALYRIWSKNSTFNSNEKMVQTMVSLLYMYFIIVNVIGGL